MRLDLIRQTNLASICHIIDFFKLVCELNLSLVDFRFVLIKGERDVDLWERMLFL